MDKFVKHHHTNILKGISIIFMYIHHFFTFPEYYVSGIAYPELSWFAKYFREPLKICVAVFAFLTGYIYCLSKNKNFKYSFRKISDILIDYWFVYACLLAVAALGVGYKIEKRTILLEAIALYRPIMIFAWYVTFYCIVMLILPFIYKKIGRLSGWSIMLIPYMISLFLQEVIDDKMIQSIFGNFTYYYPCVISGLVVAKYGIFDKINSKAKTINSGVVGCVSLILIAASCMARYLKGALVIQTPLMNFVLNLDIVYAAVFVMAVIFIVQIIPDFKIWSVFGFLGKHSLNLWFLHCIFFNISKQATQRVLYFVHNPFVVLLWGLSLCLVASLLVEIPIRYLQNIKNKIIFGGLGK